jgi:hypothetical protein
MEMETKIQQSDLRRGAENSPDLLASLIDEQANADAQTVVSQMYEDAMTEYHLARAYDAVLRDENSTVVN